MVMKEEGAGIMKEKLMIKVIIGILSWLWVSPLAVASVPEKWETTGAMATARSNQTAISLLSGPDSQILIAGGTGPSGQLASAELYNPGTGTFSPTTGPMGTARAYHTANMFWGQVLIVGGTGPSGPLASAESYDPALKTFSPTTGSMATARAYHTATLISGPAVLIAGGTGPSGPLASAELYNPGTGTFSPTTGPMGAARAHHTATLISGPAVLIAGGTGPSGPLASAEIYNPASKTFSPTTGSMGTARAYHTATILPDGMVLIAGGTGPSGPLASAEIYNPASKTFSPTAGSMGTARAYHTATILPDGMVLIVGGTGPSGQLDSVEIYDPKTGTFSSTLPMGSVREQHTACLLANGKVLIAGGIGPSGQLASAKLYSPSVYLNWQFAGPHSAYLDSLKIRVDPENEGLWYVGSQAHGIFITRNSGNTWEQHLSGLVKALEIDPNNHSIVYASSGSDLYKSANHGMNWSLVHSFPAVISDPAQLPNDSPTTIDSILVSSVYGDIYVGLASTFHHGRVYKSSDGGATWPISFETAYGLHIWDIEENPLNGYVYFCTENPSHVANALLMRSEDRGGSWVDIIPLNNPFGHGLKIQVHPVTQDVYFLTESQRVLYKSSDFGDTWTGKSVDINYDLIIDKNYPNRFFGSTVVSGTFVGGVYFSEDAEESFAFGGLAGTTPSLALNGTSTKLYAAVGNGIYVADISPIFNTLSVASSDPNSGVSITVNPSDNSSQGSGTTPFTRTYNNNTPVTLTAPSKASGHSFSSWTGCTSTSGATCNVTMNSAKAVKANFRRTHGLPWLLLLLVN